MDDPNEAFAKDCGGHWEGNDWRGCGVCERCRTVEDDLLEKERARVGRRDVGCSDSVQVANTLFLVEPCPVCADGPQECDGCYGDGCDGGGYECVRCGGSGEAIPEHCCDCRVVGPYCARCHQCGAECAGNCGCPIPVTRADGTVVTI